MQKMFTLLACVGLVICVSAYLLIHSCRRGLGELIRPLSVVGASAMADGGTLEIRLAGADGKVVVVRRIGSMAVDPSRQDLRVISYLWFVPISCEAAKGSRLEVEVKDALEVWLSSRLSSTQKSSLMRNDQNAILSFPGEVIASYGLVSWIDRRQ